MIKEIVDGHIKEWLGENEELSKKRIDICKSCSEFKESLVGLTCRVCGCRLEAKSRLPYMDCPLNKWN